MHCCVLDIASLHFEWAADGASLCARSARGEVLGVADIDADTSRSRAVFAVCDAALAQARLVRYGDDGLERVCTLGLYNPYSGEVALGAVGSGAVYRFEGGLSLGPDGALGEVDHAVLEVDGRSAAAVAIGMASTSRAVGAHPDVA